MKKIENLTVNDLEESPVWQYANSDQTGETMVKPMRKIPVKTLTGKVVGTQVRLANGEKTWALVGNVDVTNSRLTEHFVTLTFEKDGAWFTLARYHDLDYSRNGPEALAIFLGKDVSQVFPISYDLAAYAIGEKSALIGKVLKEPRERLSRSEIIAMAVP